MNKYQFDKKEGGMPNEIVNYKQFHVTINALLGSHPLFKNLWRTFSGATCFFMLLELAHEI